jgi:hypothetical protein
MVENDSVVCCPVCLAYILDVTGSTVKNFCRLNSDYASDIDLLSVHCAPLLECMTIY